MDNIGNFTAISNTCNCVDDHAHSREVQPYHYAVIHLAVDFYAESRAKWGDAALGHILGAIKAEMAREYNPEERILREFPEGMDALVRYERRDLLDRRVGRWSCRFRLALQKREAPYDLSFSIGVYEIGDSFDVASTPQYLMKASFAQHFGHFCSNSSARYFNEEDYQKLRRKRYLETQIPIALRERQLTVYLQPQYSLKTGKIVAAEALVRWKHPSLGTLMPDEFIPLFERDRYILPLDFYMLREVCGLLNRWHSEGLPVLPVSVNFSRRHAETGDFAERFLKVTERYRIRPDEIYIEWTENGFAEPDVPVRAIAGQLRANGFRIAMDDFGAGYSSLNMLTDLPVDIIKLDKQFLKFKQGEKRRRFLLQQIIRIAGSLCYTVLAEGVEYKWQAEMLRELGCDYVQGFLYSRPVPADVIERMLRKQMSGDAYRGQ